MSIQETTFGNSGKAFEITSGDCKMVVVVDVGPRVASLTRAGGPNLLFCDTEKELGFKDWKIMGGHRFWVGPETLPTYAADNAACKSAIEGQSLVVTAPADPANGYEKTLVISPAKGGFRVNHILKNVGPFLAPIGAIWSLTCVRPQGICAIPWRSGPKLWNVATIKMWAAWADHGTQLESAQFKPTKDLYQVHPTGEEGKIGSLADRGWVGQWTDDATFLKQTVFQKNATYPDDGCNIEMYTCDKFIELETLSPLVTLGPDETMEHEERWHVSAPIDITSAAVDALLAQNA